MQEIWLINMFKRMASKSPRFFKYIQFAGYGTMVICGILLYLSENDLIKLYNQDKWNEILKALVYSGFGSGTTASATSKDPLHIDEDVKQAIAQDKRLY